ncbi:hypothetical protein [Bradyrhizobium sp. BWA-3-5]|uniref:hypothetical protein n=1 Tax=Bradyrhizobium sp. BWA-3-5 TaxID=3080013 RepID=UPI00293F4C93|nr:hypothetical protein [Bradyrhizobium sp. BWA-3-5]WOH69595.1 hypothetical protein RX331_18660 [Bradyrhizobium sp. BWA-3-5]
MNYQIAVVIAMAGWLFLMIWIARQLIERLQQIRREQQRRSPHCQQAVNHEFDNVHVIPDDMPHPKLRSDSHETKAKPLCAALSP